MTGIDEMFDLRDSFFMSKLTDEKKQFAELMLRHKAFVDPHSAIIAPNWTAYIDGYKNAADYLVEHATEEWPADMLVYPTVFLYRQYLELQLKDLLQVLYKCHGLSCTPPITHNLIQIWHKMRSLVESLGKKLESVEHYDHIEARIKEFETIDKTSYSFRYPQDTQEGLSLESIKTDIGDGMLNIFQMKCVINSIYNVLQGQSEMLYQEYGFD